MHCSQSPCSSSGNLVRCYTVPEGGAREAHVPAWDCAFRSGLPSSAVSEPLVDPESPGPTRTPARARSRARSPECPDAKNPKRGGELATSSKVLYQEPSYQESDFSVHTSGKQNSAAQHCRSQFSSKHLSCVCAWPRGPHGSVSVFYRQISGQTSRQTNLMADFPSDLQADLPTL